VGVPRRVLLPLPDHDFDVTEVAVPWHYLTQAGHQVVFATESGGATPAADQRLLDGVIFGQLGAADGPKALYRRLLDDPGFRAPLAWGDAEPAEFDGLLLPGGHAPRMRQYLGSSELQDWAAAFWQLGRPVGAICHGVLVLARACDPVTGRSILADRRTTCLTKPMERSAYLATAWRLGRYYRTYPTYVEDEVVAALAERTQFTRGPFGFTRDTPTSDDSGFTVLDGNYLSARWPGDAHTFASRYTELLG
jgi:putative intracellular protease/amidase